ncbi:MAG: metalloregulator ArsR/SmtB family transcription factor [Verrucomicrobia bacterium]|nr:metalloregulator ArsR/SmtB family transcription factor [Verrucomicrobiota bacterium]
MNDLTSQIKDEFRRNDLLCTKVIGLFQLISNKARFRIVCLLVHGEFSVNEIVDIIDAGKLTNISQQLKILTLAGIISKRREKNRILYTLSNEKVRNLVGFLRKEFLEPTE